MTAIVLARLADADVEWLPGATPGLLLEKLEKTEDHDGKKWVSILDPKYILSLSESAVDVEVPGVLRMRVGFGRARDIRELRLPRSGRCLVGDWSRWTPIEEKALADLASASVSRFALRGGDLRQVIDEVARYARIDYVIAPEVRGELPPAKAGKRAKEELGPELQGCGADLADGP